MCSRQTEIAHSLFQKWSNKRRVKIETCFRDHPRSGILINHNTNHESIRMLSFTTSKQNKTRLALYTVVVIAQTAYNMVLILTPFVNDFLGTTGLQYSLSFSGYYIMVLLSWCSCMLWLLGSLCFGPISDRIGRRRAINISLLMYMIGMLVLSLSCSSHYYVLDTKCEHLHRFSYCCWGIRHNSISLSSCYCRHYQYERTTEVFGTTWEHEQFCADSWSLACRCSFKV